jgi:hypothetical protein
MGCSCPYTENGFQDGSVAESAVLGDDTRVLSTPDLVFPLSNSQTQDSRRATRAPPGPIKIPTTYHACKVEIQRSAGKSAEPRHASLKPGNSPVLEDAESTVSGISLPATLIVNGWTTLTDQPRDRHLSRRITRLDSATLPVDPFLQKYSGLSNRDRESHPPPLPIGASPVLASRFTTEQGKGDVGLGDKVLSTGDRNSCDQLLRETTASEKVFSTCKSSQTSLVVELPTPDPSDSGTPDLIKDSSTSAGGSSDTQPNTSTTSDSALSAWSGPQSGSSPASVGEIRRILDVFPATPSDHKLPSEESNALSLPSQAGLLTGERNDGSRTLLARQHRTCP